MIKNREIANYRNFVISLENALQNINSTEEWRLNAIKYVNGLAAEELRKLINLETRRKLGTFFTDSVLANHVIKFFKPKFDLASVIYDPACGAGNLLISIADYLMENNLCALTNEQLLGTDIHEEFVEASRLRLSLNNILRGNSLKSELIDYSNIKYSVRLDDGLQQNEFYKRATHIIINPPFNLMKVTEELEWSQGKVSAAALFIEKVVQNVKPGTLIYAILPDVLRSGTRYEKWRKLINETCIVGKIKLLGQFDKHTDIDVFAIELTKRQSRVELNLTNLKSETFITDIRRLEDLFHVCVGPVVDNRDPSLGKQRGYIVSKGLKGWTENKKPSLKRRYTGKSFQSPFVVVKRTSRMGDNQRAVATIINTTSPVYVDNHLIILKPKSGTLEDCNKALSILKMPETDAWLNDKIRCRHLTVKVVSKIPIWQ